ncbi:MAG: phosphoribosylformylglycinamidine synthase subunit PurL [Chloroflexota bacterium]|nr:phosphoribosylformylglycinamidine synthase subunit PurL [Chloroflexota bacterium]
MTLTPTHEPPSDEVLREVALTRDEYHFAADLLDRPPNPVELGIIGGMWSEHCGYKHSRPLLSRLPSEGPQVLIGPGEENAGAVDIGHGLAIVMKVESHNHPSAVEPFQGAATGVGGILRDIFTMGARPIALLDSLRFGPLDDRRGRYLANGIVGGIGWYGNCMGVPTVGGEVQVSASYRGNPLVNAMCVGLIQHEQLTSAAASGAGNELILVGADTGRDGIHGATFASVDDPEASHRGVVQVGNPFMEKLLLEACLEVLQTTDAILGLQDLGATGLTSSSVESAGRGGTGVVLNLEHVARRAAGMTPYEVMLSESQERMLVVAARGRAHEVQRVFDKWGLHSDVIGEVTETGLLDVRDNGHSAASLPITMLTDAPTYTYPVERPAYLDEVGSLNLQVLPEPDDPTAAFLQLLASPNIASRRPIYRQYDHMVGANTVIAPGGDAALLRIKGTPMAVALSTDGNGRTTYLDPFVGGAAAIAESARNVSCTGARPLAFTNCLNFGSPEQSAAYYQLSRAIDGMAAAARTLETPVISGNVSLYNESGGEAIWPTPVVGMLGVLDELDRRCGMGFASDGDEIAVLGAGRPRLDGSEYLSIANDRVAGQPEINLVDEVAVQRLVRELIAGRLLSSAHDCSDGGLATALAESAFAGERGVVAPNLPIPERLDEALFGESQSRIIVSYPPLAAAAVAAAAATLSVPITAIGRVGGDCLRIGPIDVPLARAEQVWSQGLEHALAGHGPPG